MNGETVQLAMQTTTANGATDPFRARMSAQVYLIEGYRKEQLKKFGRRLSRNEAAAEWISRFAADFPSSLAA